MEATTVKSPLPPELTVNSERDRIQRLITKHQRRLQPLQEQKAHYGIDTRPHIITEIEDIQAEIARLQAELETLPDSSSSANQSKIENPFVYGGAVPPQMFYGRQDVVQVIVRRVGGRTAQSISIVGERRMGKTSLLTYINRRAADLFSPDLKLLPIHLDLTKAYSRTLPGLMRALRRELTRAWREPWPKEDDHDLGVFDFALEDLQAEGIRLVLCLDEMENLTQRGAEFDALLEDWRAGGSLGQLAIVTASAEPLADLCASGGLTSPFYNIFEQQRLGLLAPAEWQALVTDNMAATPGDLALIERVAGGQPFFTQMAADYLWQAYAWNAVDHTALYRALTEQISPHLQNLWAKLTPLEQRTLRSLAAPGTLHPDARVRDSLTRRGIVRDEQPFSQMFAEMIAGGEV